LLKRSLDLQVTVSTLLNLGLCNRSLDRLATAHEYYRQAEIMAMHDGDSERSEFAHEASAEIAPLRATLLLQLTDADDQALEVSLDEVVQPREVWRRPWFINAGDHRLAVYSTGQGHNPWHSILQVRDGEHYVVSVPTLTLESQQKPSAAEAREPLPTRATPLRVPAPLVESTPSPPAVGPSTPRILASVAGGAGLIALGVSVAFGLSAQGANADSRAECRNDVCTQKGVGLRADAHADATRATVLGVGGGAAFAAGLLLWILDPGHREARSKDSVRLDVGTQAWSARYTGHF
jgi:hypothetical protein